jgi:hypothetical protein
VLCGTRRLIPPSDMIFLRTIRITLYRRTTHTYAVRVSSFFFFYFFSTFTVYPSLAYVRRPRGAQIQDWRLVIHPHPINIAPLSLPLSPFFFFPSFMRYYITLRYFFLSLILLPRVCYNRISTNYKEFRFVSLSSNLWADIRFS